MTLFQLECCLALSEHLNYTQAAEVLYITQPVLSRTISGIESEIGMTLFTRSSRSVALTPAGHFFLKGAAQILEIYRRALDEAQLSQQGIYGEVKVGILRDTFDPFLVEVALALHRTFPDIHLSFLEYSHSELIRAFDAGNLDTVVDYCRPSRRPEWDWIVLRNHCQCAVVPIFSPLSTAKVLRVEQLKDEHFVAMSRIASSSGYNFLWKITTDAGFTPHVVAEATYIPSLLMKVASGEGITILTDNLTQIAGNKVKFIPLADLPLEEVGLAWRQDNTNPSLPLFLKMARDVQVGQPLL